MTMAWLTIRYLFWIWALIFTHTHAPQKEMNDINFRRRQRAVTYCVDRSGSLTMQIKNILLLYAAQCFTIHNSLPILMIVIALSPLFFPVSVFCGHFNNHHHPQDLQPKSCCWEMLFSDRHVLMWIWVLVHFWSRKASYWDWCELTNLVPKPLFLGKEMEWPGEFHSPV